MKEIIAVDMFCGAGGESSGLVQACGELGLNLRLSAINHWETAIKTHAANHPFAEHFCEDVETLKPGRVVSRCRKVGLLWASPECTHHSNARGGRPRDEQSRATAWHVLKWLQELYVERVIIENVPEFIKWGPLGVRGKPLKSKRGMTFRAFVAALESLDYTVDWRILNAADYGDPTTRRRFFLQAVRGRKQILWPQPLRFQNAEDPSMRWRSASECIDWSILGTSIFNRSKPLCENTLARIAHGLQKYGGAAAEPFMVLLNGGGAMKFARTMNEPVPVVTTGNHIGIVQPFLIKQYGQSKSGSVNDPVPTVTAGPGHNGLVQPFITRFNGGSERNHSIEEPVPVIDCSNRYGIVSPFVVAWDQQNGGNCVWDVNSPLSTITTKQRHGIIEPFIIKYNGTGRSNSVNEPLDAITTKDRFGIIQAQGYDILFRMFRPKELARAHSFEEDYQFCGNNEDAVKQIGNSVPCRMAKALCKTALSQIALSA